MTPSGPLPRQHDPDEFGIEINYEAHSDAPSRVFRVMTALIDAFQEIDGYLAASISSTLQPSTLLEDIETGSLRVWLRNILKSVDDDALKSGEVKKIIGNYLVSAKRVMIRWTEERTEVTSSNDLAELQKSILEEASKTGILRIPMYAPVPTSEVAKSVELISSALEPLHSGESVKYLSADSPPAEFNTSFHVVPEALTELLVKESLVNEADMILMVKKPDFLGDSRWEFRHGTGSLPARLNDAEWLVNFRLGNVPLLPGDALRARVRSTARYGYDGDVVDLQYEIIKVLSVIRAARPIQGNLLPGEPSGQ